MNIVVMAPSGSRDARTLGDGRDDITVIGWDDTDADIELKRPAGFVSCAQRLAGRSFIAQIPMRLFGLDSATQFARRCAAEAQAGRVLQGAELIVAADSDAAFAAWRSARGSTSRPRVVSGLAAAREVLRTGRGTPS